MQFGFSYVGLIFLIMLFAPNLIWIKNKPAGYEKIAANESKILSVFEKAGQIGVTCFALIFKDFNINTLSERSIILSAAFLLMLIYEAYWIKYFKSERSLSDFYGNILGIPLAGATLPVAAFLLLGIYGKNIFMIIAVTILGIGHIGLHLNHKKEIDR